MLMSAGLKIIVVTGPESSGKSFLTNLLAEKFQLPMVSEYAREYIDGLERAYVEADLEVIANGQYKKLEAIDRLGKSWAIMDTDMLTIKIWGLEKYGQYPEILDVLANQFPVTHYLCCKPDIPWEYDPQREHSNDRERLFHKYLKELETNNFPFTVIQGDYSQRISSSIKIVEQLIQT